MGNPRDTLTLIAGDNGTLQVRIILSCWWSQGKVGVGVVTHGLCPDIAQEHQLSAQSRVCVKRGYLGLLIRFL